LGGQDDEGVFAFQAIEFIWRGVDAHAIQLLLTVLSKRLLWRHLARFVKTQWRWFFKSRSMQRNIVPLKEGVARPHKAEPDQPDANQQHTGPIDQPLLVQASNPVVEMRLQAG